MKDSDPLDWDVLREDVAHVERGVGEWDEELRRVRARFLLSAKGQPLRPKAKRVPAVWAAVALAASVGIGLFGWSRGRRETPVSFDTGAEHAVGHLGAEIAAPGPQGLPVHFSDGTVLSMASATHARVTDASSHGATIVLEEGSLEVAVVHREASSWHVAAGPFTVLVTGTKFDVRWSAAEQTLALDLHEGSVTVLGPSLGSAGRRVLPGESLRVSVGEKHDAPSETAFSAAAPGAVAPGAADAPPPASSNEEGAKALAADLGGSGHSSWRQLALDGRYPEALAAAESEGFDGACRRASAADLLLLGDTARFAGSPRRAEQALQLIRSRDSGKHEAAMSAFALGRIAYDQRRRYREAAHWFQSYLREEPTGGLAREAAGRLIEAESAAGELAGARDAASAYLAKYPAGPHAALARSVLNR